MKKCSELIFCGTREVNSAPEMQRRLPFLALCESHAGSSAAHTHTHILLQKKAASATKDGLRAAELSSISTSRVNAAIAT
jgi:hypothetical protein